MLASFVVVNGTVVMVVAAVVAVADTAVVAGSVSVAVVSTIVVMSSTNVVETTQENRYIHADMLPTYSRTRDQS